MVGYLDEAAFHIQHVANTTGSFYIEKGTRNHLQQHKQTQNKKHPKEEH